MPAPEARLSRYDPWAAFRANANRYRTVSQPYLELLELYRILRDEETRGVRPTEPQGRSMSGSTAANRHILDRCNRHGPLGIFPIMSTLVRLSDVADRDELAIKRTHYVRDGDRWHLETTSQFDWLSTPQETEDRLRERVTETHGTVNWFNFGSRAYDELPIEKLRHYFPLTEGVGDTLIPPLPLSDEFWRLYREPVREIRRYCYHFGRAVDYLRRWNDEVSTDKQHPNVKRASMLLRDLAQNVVLNDFDDTRTSAGLLASYALMFLWDRMEGRRCLQCDACDHYFVSNDRRARYCSPRCRTRTQSRRHREKQAAKRTTP